MPEAVASDARIELGGVTEVGRIDSPVFCGQPSAITASQTTIGDFIPFKNELISLGTHKKSMRLVIDPTIDPVSRRYDQADILAPGEECSLDCDVVIDRAVSRELRPGPTWRVGDALEDI
jgi:hypothetical protein